GMRTWRGLGSVIRGSRAVVAAQEGASTRSGCRAAGGIVPCLCSVSGRLNVKSVAPISLAFGTLRRTLRIIRRGTAVDSSLLLLANHRQNPDIYSSVVTAEPAR